MTEKNAKTGADGVVEILCDFVRNRSVLLTHGNLRALFERWHRHHDTHGIDLEPAHAALFEDALAAWTLHLAGQSRNKHMTWTVNIGKPAVNLFLGGDTYTGSVTGRVFTENVATFDKGQFYQESYVAGKGPFRSYATFEGAGIFGAIEQYYAMSEQRPAKIFDLGDCNFAMAHAHPDYDEGWFTGLTAEIVRDIATQEELGRIETRSFGWNCGCEDPHRILGALLASYAENPDNLFGADASVEVSCPRCAAKHRVSREDMAKFAEYEAKRKSGGDKA